MALQQAERAGELLGQDPRCQTDYKDERLAW
jgi:hypothetical protein